MDIREVHGEEVRLPLVVFPRLSVQGHMPASALQACARRYLPRLGSILFRGFNVRDEPAFRAFMALFGEAMRIDVSAGGAPSLPSQAGSVGGRGTHWVKTCSGEHRAQLCAERWYCRRYPARIWIHCAGARARVAIADAREVYAALPGWLQRSWDERGLRLTRWYAAEGQSSWQASFGASEPRELDVGLRAQGFDCTWQADGRLRLSITCPAIIRHPISGENVWFNAAHALWSARRWMGHAPLQVFHGDGEPIDEHELQLVQRAFDAVKVSIPVEAGDVLLLDNVLMAHAVESGPGSSAVSVARTYADGAPPGPDPIAPS